MAPLVHLSHATRRAHTRIFSSNVRLRHRRTAVDCAAPRWRHADADAACRISEEQRCWRRSGSGKRRGERKEEGKRAIRVGRRGPAPHSHHSTVIPHSHLYYPRLGPRPRLCPQIRTLPLLPLRTKPPFLSSLLSLPPPPPRPRAHTPLPNCHESSAARRSRESPPFRVARETTLWFLGASPAGRAAGNLAEFWALSDLARDDAGVSVRSATGRTCTVVLTRCPPPCITPAEGSEEDDEREETEFQMIDGKERWGIVEWVRRHKSAFGIAVGQGPEAGGADAEGGVGREEETRIRTRISRRRAGRVTACPRFPVAPVQARANTGLAKKVTTKAGPLKVPRVVSKQRVTRDSRAQPKAAPTLMRGGSGRNTQDVACCGRRCRRTRR